MVLRLADRVMKTLADVTVGSVIVLAHVAIADRERARVRALDDNRALGRPASSAQD